MDYVALMTFRAGADAVARDAAMARRASWQYPAGVTPIAEYWPMASGPQVVSIFGTDDPADVMSLVLEWNDVFDVSVHPAVSAEAGLQIGARVMANLQRLRG